MSANRLFVIVGAGASADCATSEWRNQFSAQSQPPLVKDLFSPKYARILDQYPVVQMVAADLAKTDIDALVIEEHIRRRYRDSDHPIDKLKFLALPPYLQHLLFEVSHVFARSPDNHDRLIDALLRLPDVVFISLNYDTLLDDRLSLISPLDELDAYIASRDPSWSLVKLHGSVNWGREILSDLYVLERPTLDLRLNDEIRLRHGSEIRSIRRDTVAYTGTPSSYYPVVSVPVGRADEIVCPPKHLDFLKEKLETAYDGLDLLVIGYSGNDQEVLSLLRENGRPIRSLCVVNLDKRTASQVAEKLRTDLDPIRIANVRVFDGSYSSFATASELKAYADWLERLPSLEWSPLP